MIPVPFDFFHRFCSLNVLYSTTLPLLSDPVNELVMRRKQGAKRASCLSVTRENQNLPSSAKMTTSGKYLRPWPNVELIIAQTKL